MKKIFVDLGYTRVGILTSFMGSENEWTLTLLDGQSTNDGVYCPPQHVWLDRHNTKALYDALKAIYEPTVVG